MEPVRWGILSTAKIGIESVIPAMLEQPSCRLCAIASRNPTRAQSVADDFEIPRAYGSYSELFDDPEIEVIYNPLPNHLHVSETIAAVEAGKHVLCEKPIALNSQDISSLITARDKNNRLILEGLMIRYHPQWLRVRDLVMENRLGDVKAINCIFSYFNRDAEDIRNQLSAGGGALYDIGVYPVVASRFILNREPHRVLSNLKRDPEFGTDIVSTATLDYGDVVVNFVCSTQMVDCQRFSIFGTKGRLDIQIPFNAPANEVTRLYLDDGRTRDGASIKKVEIEACNQYGLQAAEFGKYIREDIDPPFPLEDSYKNALVIDALFQSDSEQKWVSLQSVGE